MKRDLMSPQQETIDEYRYRSNRNAEKKKPDDLRHFPTVGDEGALLNAKVL
jgi:hypothetical protein